MPLRNKMSTSLLRKTLHSLAEWARCWDYIRNPALEKIYSGSLPPHVPGYIFMRMGAYGGHT